MILSAQSIEERCQGPRPLITPFQPHKVVRRGKSGGLSAASYDCHIDHALTLGRSPGHVVAAWLLEQDLFSLRGVWRTSRGLRDLFQRLKDEPPAFALAYTQEDFDIPADLSAAVCDKSSYARVFVTAFNTFFDPGFRGNATLELVNLGDQPVHLQKGDPICQFIFSKLDQPTDRPYAGKYQHQTKAAHGARHELGGGGWIEAPKRGHALASRDRRAA